MFLKAIPVFAEHQETELNYQLLLRDSVEDLQNSISSLLGMLEQLAGLVNGEISSSRPLVDMGWLPHSRQIGQSGATVTPKLMFNIGVSGSVQYVLGMQKAGCIVVVNTTPDAPIFDYAHYGVVADYRKFIPALIEEIKARKA